MPDLVTDGNTPGATEVAAGTEDAANPAINQPSPDGVTEPSEWEVKYNDLKAKSEKDIGAVKSALESRNHEAKKDADGKISAIQLALDELTTRDMDETQKAIFNNSKLEQDLADTKAQLLETQNASQQQAAVSEWTQFYLKAGVAADKLAGFTDVGELVRAGQSAIVEELAAYREGKIQADAPAGDVTPPNVTTKSGESVQGGHMALVEAVTGGKTWAHQDKFYEMVEEQRVPQDLINSYLGDPMKEE